MQSAYAKPEIIAPVVTSDHKVVKWYPNNSTVRPSTTTFLGLGVTRLAVGLFHRTGL